MKPAKILVVTGVLLLGGASSAAEPPITQPITVRDARGFQRAVEQAGPGTRILVAPGKYPGGFHFTNVKGEPHRPVVIAAADAKNPPIFRGGNTGLHLTDAAHVELHDLAFVGAGVNGLNIDDGGSYESPTHDIVLRRLKVSEVGSNGNHDGVKLSGLNDFRVEGCSIERWGTGGGSGIDMVGCHRGVIEGNTFRHSDDSGSTGVQAKGGSRGIVIRRNRFENAGGRAVNIGGSTGPAYFRPSLQRDSQHHEAQDIRVEGNTFIGSGAPIAFVGADRAVVRFNTIYRPKRWGFRILRENREPGFVPSQLGEFTDNIVVFRSDEWREGGVNVGPHTAPETFRFARNLWYCEDDPPRSKDLVRLPNRESDGLYGENPQFLDAANGDLRLQSNSPAQKAGADALPK
jgi:hypothetical protein